MLRLVIASLFAFLLHGQCLASTQACRLTNEIEGQLQGHCLSIASSSEQISDLKSLMAQPQTWQAIPGNHEIPNLRYLNHPVWFRLALDHPVVSNDWIFEIDSKYFELIDMYFLAKNDVLKHVTAGNEVGFARRDLSVPTYSFTVPRGTTELVFLVKTTGHMKIPARFWKVDSFYNRMLQATLLHGAFIGLLAVMFLYNFVLAINLSERMYFLYSLSVASLLLLELGATGWGFQYLWPNSSTLQSIYIYLVSSLLMITAITFTMSFLRTKQTIPKVHKVLLVYLGMGLTGFGVYFLIWTGFIDSDGVGRDIGRMIGATTSLQYPLILLLTGILRVIQRDRTANFFVLAWTAYLSGIFCTLLVLTGHIEETWFLENAYLFGASLEVVLLSFALSNRISQLRAGMIDAQQELITNMKKLDQMKDSLLANTSHELRTPIHGILGLAESLLTDQKFQVDSHRRTVKLIASSSQRLSHLVNDILDFSSLRAENAVIEKRPISLAGVVDYSIQLCSSIAEKKGIALESTVPYTMPAVLADDNRLHQIFNNLLGNAVKYSDHGTVRVSCEVEESTVTVAVSDSGIGISPDKIESVFNAFEQSHERQHRGGTGLGLSIAKKLIEAHDGKIWVESIEGQGSTFYFTLNTTHEAVSEIDQAARALGHPILDVESEQQEQSYPLVETSAVKAARNLVLAVDDETLNLELVQRFLNPNEYVIETAKNGADAVHLVLEEGLRPDVILMDIMMPQMNGLDACAHIRKQLSKGELPIVFMTAKSLSKDLSAAFSVGGNDFIVKPFTRAELVNRVASHVAMKRLFENEVAIAKVTKDSEAANMIQKTLLPNSIHIPGVNVASHYQPAEKTGGDWFQIRHDPIRDRMFGFIADVSGHGVPSAMVTALICGAIESALNELVSYRAIKAPSIRALLLRLVDCVNKTVVDTVSQSNFSLTMSLFGIDLRFGNLYYLNAGHVPAFILSKQSIQPLAEPSPLIGVNPSPCFHVSKHRIPEGGTLVFLSDGMIETRNANGRRYGLRTLVSCLAMLKDKSADSIVKGIINDFQSYRGMAKNPTDDVTLLVVEFLGTTAFESQRQMRYLESG